MLGPADVDQDYIASSKLLYLTGITPALSGSCLAACTKAADLSRSAGLKIAFDMNIRPNLWLDQDPRKALLPFLHKADIIFTDISDTQMLMGEGNTAKAAQKLMVGGASIVVMKGGAKKRHWPTQGRRSSGKGPSKCPLSTRWGLGTFSGVSSCQGYLKGWKVQECLAAGSAAGPLVVTTRGDQENILTESEITDFLKALAKDDE